MCDCCTYEDQFTEFPTYTFWVRVCVKCGRVIYDWTVQKEPEKEKESE